MNLSSNKDKIVRTADGVPLKEGMSVYVPNVESAQITRYIINHWNNGINALCRIPEKGERVRNNRKFYYESIKGWGGAGFYISKDSDYCPRIFIHTKNSYSTLNKARAYIKRKAQRESNYWNEIAEKAFNIIAKY